MNTKSRSVTLLLGSSPLGFLGLDRLYLDQPLLFILKFFTFGGLGVWYLVDACINFGETFASTEYTFLNKNVRYVDVKQSFYVGILLLFVLAFCVILAIDFSKQDPFT